MALKKGLPAIRAAWLWQWQQKMILKTTSLLGTRVLIVAENSRVVKSCSWQKNGKTGKIKARYWLAKGTILVPRWDRLKLHYDPVADKGVESLNAHEQKARGIYCLDNGELVLLIYQHVEDVLHFQRQQWHIMLEVYPKELQKISNHLAAIEKKALTDNYDVLETLNYRQRRAKIYGIVSHLAVRDKAAEILLKTLGQEIDDAKKSLANCLGSKSVKDFQRGTLTDTSNIRAYLARIYLNLSQIKVRPIVRSLTLAQYQLKLALGSLDLAESGPMVHHLELAIKNLEEAQKSLSQK